MCLSVPRSPAVVGCCSAIKAKHPPFSGSHIHGVVKELVLVTLEWKGDHAAVAPIAKHSQGQEIHFRESHQHRLSHDWRSISMIPPFPSMLPLWSPNVTCIQLARLLKLSATFRTFVTTNVTVTGSLSLTAPTLPPLVHGTSVAFMRKNTARCAGSPGHAWGVVSSVCHFCAAAINKELST